MKIDLTKEVQLEEDDRKKYKKRRWVLSGLALALFLYYAFIILFPSKEFNFFFENPTALSSNNQISENDQPVDLQAMEEMSSSDQGKILPEKNFKFYATLTGRFSEADLKIKLKDDSSPIKSERIEIKKSYQAFFYPEGDPVGFREGSLLKNENEYFIISKNELRKFQSMNILEALGYSPDSFWEVSKEELAYNPQGEPIADQSEYPDGTIFEVEGENYILSEGRLKSFLSQEAFLTRYDSSWKIQKEKNFLEEFDIADEKVGFSNGSLVAAGGTVYIISENKAMPIGSPEIFEAKGYFWEDVLEVKNKDLEMYQKTEIFYLSHPHPNGTIFSSNEGEKWYIVRDNEKHPLLSRQAALSWSKSNPVKVSSDSLKESIFCNLEREKSGYQYSCSADVSLFIDLEGKEYQFNPNFQNEIQIDEINLTFKRSFDWPNLKFAVKDVLQKLILKYAGEK